MNTQVGQHILFLFMCNVFYLFFYHAGYSHEPFSTAPIASKLILFTAPIIAFIYESYWYNKNFK